MTFRKVDLIFVVLALLVVGGVALLPSPRDRNPKVPANSTHQAMRNRVRQRVGLSSRIGRLMQSMENREREGYPSWI